MSNQQPANQAQPAPAQPAPAAPTQPQAAPAQAPAPAPNNSNSPAPQQTAPVPADVDAEQQARQIEDNQPFPPDAPGQPGSVDANGNRIPNAAESVPGAGDPGGPDAHNPVVEAQPNPLNQPVSTPEVAPAPNGRNAQVNTDAVDTGTPPPNS